MVVVVVVLITTLPVPLATIDGAAEGTIAPGAMGVLATGGGEYDPALSEATDFDFDSFEGASYFGPGLGFVAGGAWTVPPVAAPGWMGVAATGAGEVVGVGIEGDGASP